jgi:hypothetical protein
MESVINSDPTQNDFFERTANRIAPATAQADMKRQFF